MLTFRQFLTESSAVTTAATIAITARISGLQRQVAQDRTATQADKIISNQIFWLSSLVALGIVTAEKCAITKGR